MGKLEQEIINVGGKIYLAVVLETQEQFDEFEGRHVRGYMFNQTKKVRICPSCNSKVLKFHHRICSGCKKVRKRNCNKVSVAKYYKKNKERINATKRAKYKESKKLLTLP